MNEMSGGRGEVKSLSVVKFSSNGGDVTAQFSELAQETNLNSPPSNWLRGKLAEKEPFVPGGVSGKREFNSLVMGNKFPESVGEVDVIADAENVKKLICIPCEGSPPASLIVHRVGKTLLVDDFNSYRHLLNVQEEDWQWLRQFVTQVMTENGSGRELIARAAQSKDIQEKIMMSKFLYHSIGNDHASCRPPEQEVESSNDNLNLPLLVPDPLEDEDAPKGPPRHDRNFLWTFEDMRMLVGTNMPIFGCGTHPCVTLKLRDMKKPINVLTGIDYWLDQLMCNVPEVVMCYHLDGIVQKYEIIPTEELPDFPDSKFSPDVVKGVAQNIVSFLKNNATKEGHTYWLFRAKNDDVVKLYDLSSLCENFLAKRADANPFTLPVAILQYRVAKNLMQQSENAPRRCANTIYRLLNNCLELLGKDSYPQVVGSVHYLLANLYLSYGTSGSPPSGSGVGVGEGGTGELEDREIEDWTSFEDESWEQTQAGEASTCVSLELLKRVGGVGEVNSTAGSSKPSRRPLPNCTNLDDCCKEALEHIYEGFECAEVLQRFPEEEEKKTSPEEVNKKAEPSAPIPLKYEPLKKVENGVLPFAVRQPLASSWQTELIGLLLIQSATAYRLLAESSQSLGHYGRSLKYAKLGFICLESVKFLAKSVEASRVQSRITKKSREVSRELIPSFLALCGDTYGLLARGDDSNRPRETAEFRGSLHFRDMTILNRAKKILGDHFDNGPYQWVTTSLPFGVQECLTKGEACYEAALKERKRFERVNSATRYLKFISALPLDKQAVLRNLANLKNEMGTFYTNLLQELVTEGEFRKPDSVEIPEETETIAYLVQKGEEAFIAGIKIFEEVEDRSNQALLCSNCARLMRLKAYAESQKTPEFTPTERKLLEKAIDYYNRGLVKVNPKMSDKVWETVVAELASTFQTLAVQLQERPPLSTHTMEEIEREITEVMHKGLRQYDLMAEMYKDTYLAAHALARSVDMNYRLGSLYHTLYRRKEDVASKRAKTLKALAELHYNKAVDTYRSLISKSPSTQTVGKALDFLRLQIERVSLTEHIISNISSSQGKEKLYHQILEILGSGCCSEWKYLEQTVTALPMGQATEENTSRSSIENQSGKEQTESENITSLGLLFLERAQNAAKSLLQLKSEALKKQGKNQTDVGNWKSLYKKTLIGVPKELPTFIAAISSLSFQLVPSSQTLSVSQGQGAT